MVGIGNVPRLDMRRSDGRASALSSTEGERDGLTVEEPMPSAIDGLLVDLDV